MLGALRVVFSSCSPRDQEASRKGIRDARIAFWRRAGTTKLETRRQKLETKLETRNQKLEIGKREAKGGEKSRSLRRGRDDKKGVARGLRGNSRRPSRPETQSQRTVQTEAKH